MRRNPAAEQSLTTLAALRKDAPNPAPSAVTWGDCAAHILSAPQATIATLEKVSSIPSRSLAPIVRVYATHGLIAFSFEAGAAPHRSPRRYDANPELVAFMSGYNHLFGNELKLGAESDESVKQLVARGLRCMAVSCDVTLSPDGSIGEYVQRLQPETGCHPQTLIYRGLGMLAAAYGVERHVNMAINAAVREREA